MSFKINFFFRHSQPNYFSIEKLFQKISTQISNDFYPEFVVQELYMPLASKPRTLYQNVQFAKKNQAFINHITGDIHYAIFGYDKKNINVITIHDCVTLHRYAKTSLRYRLIKLFWFDLPVKKADLVTVISENTRRDLIYFTKCDPDKIRVVSNFVDPELKFSDFKFNKECPRILFVGTTPNKNLLRLIEALNGISCILDIVGPLDAERLDKLKENNINFEQSQRLSQQALREKYMNCDMVAFPSTYEGFGLPIVEAQATGRPLLTSDLSPMRDVAGAGACLILPYNVKSIREGLLKIINDDDYRKKIVEKGTENVRRFSIDHVTGQYASIYRELIQKKFKT